MPFSAVCTFPRVTVPVPPQHPAEFAVRVPVAAACWRTTACRLMDVEHGLECGLAVVDDDAIAVGMQARPAGGPPGRCADRCAPTRRPVSGGVWVAACVGKEGVAAAAAGGNWRSSANHASAGASPPQTSSSERTLRTVHKLCFPRSSSLTPRLLGRPRQASRVQADMPACASKAIARPRGYSAHPASEVIPECVSGLARVRIRRFENGGQSEHLARVKLRPPVDTRRPRIFVHRDDVASEGIAKARRYPADRRARVVPTQTPWTGRCRCQRLEG